MSSFEYPELKFTRQEFYDKLWSIPIEQLAKELGCSVFMIGNACERCDIPTPDSGYWTLLENGRIPVQIPLPKNTNPSIQTVTVSQYPQRQKSIAYPSREALYDADICKLLKKARELGPVVVSDTLQKPHPLVATWKAVNAKKIANSKRPWKDQEHISEKVILDIHVSEQQSLRAILIMDALLKRIEKLGGKIELKPTDHRLSYSQTMIVFVGTVAARIRLREQTTKPRIKSEEPDTGWERKRPGYVPNGMLLFDPGPQSHDNWMPKDTKTLRLENYLDELIVGCIRQAGEQRILERERHQAKLQRLEEENRKRQKAFDLQRKREELKRLQDAENAQITELMDRVKGWKESQAIQDFIEAVCQKCSLEDGAMPIRGEVADYLRWANGIADRFNPLKRSPPSILDEQID